MSHAARLLISYQLCLESGSARGPIALQDEIAGNLFCEKVHECARAPDPRPHCAIQIGK
jgi:hypothetical protein